MEANGQICGVIAFSDGKAAFAMGLDLPAVQNLMACVLIYTLSVGHSRNQGQTFHSRSVSTCPTVALQPFFGSWTFAAVIGKCPMP